jgi:outer membrane protein
MADKESPRNLRTHVFLIMACFAIASCASSKAGLPQDYIGPGPERPKQEGSLPHTDVAPETPVIEAEGPLEITVQAAILLALEHNRALKVEKFNPARKRTAEEEARSAFDPIMTGEYARLRERTDHDLRPGGRSVDNETNANLGVTEYLPTGTEIGIEMSTQQTWSDLYSDDLYESRLGLSVTQALLKGAGLGYNLAGLRQARLDTSASLYELRGFAEALVAQVEETYWEYALNQRQIEIFLESLKLAQQQRDEAQEMIKIGYLAESELAAAQAEIAVQREGLINARSNLEKTRLQLLRLLNPPDSEWWQREVMLLHQPAVPKVELDDVESHVELAMKMRPDLNQARLQVMQGDLQIVRTKNGLLPKMDFFIDLGKTGYADSFGRSLRDMDGDSYDAGAGLSLQFPPVNRQARALYHTSLLNRAQAEEALKNLDQLVQVDVRSAYIEVNRAKEQIAATSATRVLQEEKARIEREKFRVGNSTSLLVAQAQRDLLTSRIAEIRATINYLKALIELYRLEGSLLERRGIMAPGNQPAGNQATYQ